MRPAQDAYRGCAFPASLVDAVKRDTDTRRRLQANYRAKQAMAQRGVGELDVPDPRVDRDAQVDVALADFDEIDAGLELARHRRRPPAGHHQVGGEFEQGLAVESAGARGKAEEKGDQSVLALPAENSFLCVLSAGAIAHGGGPLSSGSMFTGTCDGLQ
jgi:hypothetical protein